jgi:hypothetical protein
VLPIGRDEWARRSVLHLSDQLDQLVTWQVEKLQVRGRQAAAELHEPVRDAKSRLEG